ncbi:hypothetical protein LIER_23989 [Lithospermum erythrorhizon]|uniref:Uncharacterized protein n=1 Tax=Lithospermum erythrorhizon TaxID=34254 RepID=A0AAV3R0W9_LITER
MEGLAHLSPEIREAVMPLGFKMLTFMKYTGKNDLEDHIVEFQSQLSFYQSNGNIYCPAFPVSFSGSP